MPFWRRRLLVRLAVALAGVWLAWVGWTLLSVSAQASTARAQVRAERDLDIQAFLDGEAAGKLEGHAGRFKVLSQRLGHPLLLPVRWLPVAGRQLDAARQQMAAAETGLHAASVIAEGLLPLVRDGLSSGPERVTTLRTIEQIVRDGMGEFEGLDLGTDDKLIGPLSNSRAEFGEAQAEVIDTLARAAAMGAGLARFFEGPSDYLLFAANNAQMQNGQGMFLSAGVLHVEDGSLDLGPVESINSLPPVVSVVPLEADLADRWGWLDPNRDLRHLGLSARFPVTGRTATELWASLGNPEVDGVVVVDPLVLEAIMRATGPVSVAEATWHAEDIVRYTLHDQYQGYLSAGKDGSYTVERRDELDDISRAVLDAFEQVSEVEPEFLEDFRSVAAGRHLLLWARDPMVQAGFEAAGVDGQIGPHSLLLSLVNRSGNKLDWFMRMSADLVVERDGDGFAATLDIAVTNNAPSDGEPRYVVGPYPGSGLDRAEYLGLVTLNLPGTATDSRFEGVDRLAVAGADGPNRTIAAWVNVPSGSTVHIVAKFRLPASTASIVVEPSARKYATSWSFGGKDWKDTQGRSLPL